MILSGSFATGQSTEASPTRQSAGSSSKTRSPVANNSNSVNSKSSHQPSTSYMPGINKPILTGTENHSKWESQMKVHFMGIRIIGLLHPKDKNPIPEEQENYKTYNNKGVVSIYAKINDD